MCKTFIFVALTFLFFSTIVSHAKFYLSTSPFFAHSPVSKLFYHLMNRPFVLVILLSCMCYMRTYWLFIICINIII